MRLPGLHLCLGASLFTMLLACSSCNSNIRFSHGDISFINVETLDDRAVLKQVKSRSFLQCCMECVSSENCTGAAYRDGECNFIDVTAAGTSLAKLQDVSGNYKVMHKRPRPILAGKKAFYFEIKTNI